MLPIYLSFKVLTSFSALSATKPKEVMIESDVIFKATEI